MPRIATTTASNSNAVTIPSSWLTESWALLRDVSGIVDGDVGVVGEGGLDRRLGLGGVRAGRAGHQDGAVELEVTLAVKSGIVIT